jgi:hypothetical protein
MTNASQTLSDFRSRAARISVADRPATTHDPVAALRVVTMLGLLAMALIHLLDLPGTMGPDPVQGTLYLLLMAGSLVAAFRLVHATSLWRFALPAALAASAVGAYVLTRTLGLPFDHADVGNWNDPLGTAALFVEGVTIAAASYGIVLAARSTR